MTNTDWMAEFERLLNEYVGAQVAYTLQPEMSLLREAGEARSALLHHARMRPAEGWMPIESAPKDGRTLLLGHFNSHGKWRTARGQWFSRNVIEETWEHEEADEGWYETSVECDADENCWWTEPTHWMPLPQPPIPAAPGAAPSLPEDQPSGRTYKDVDELFSAMGIPPSSQRMESKPLSPEEEERLIEAGVRSAIAQFGAERFARMLAAVSLPKEGEQEALEAMRALKDAAYEERNKVVAALAKLFPSGIARTAIEGWSDDWHGCVYIDLPTGQVSWHFHDSQAHLFDGLPPYTKPWDGHDTPEKYRRLAALPPSSGGSDEQIARRLVAWDDSGNTQGEHHETLREIINSARAALSKASPPSDRQEGGQA